MQMRAVRSVAAVGCGLIMLVTMGCGVGPKDQQIEALQNEVNKLQGEKQDLMARLQRALAERDEARGRVADLMQQLAALKGKEPTAPDRGRWHGNEQFAWTDISESILFDSGKADLKAAGRTELQTVLNEARQKYPGHQIWIVGHTDTDPIKHSKWKDNLELSVQRGCTIFREMQKLGVDPKNMVAAGQGEYNPKASNANSAGKAQNRRVQIIAIRVPSDTGPTIESPTGEQG
jgi:chemotaxis protein MotB